VDDGNDTHTVADGLFEIYAQSNVFPGYHSSQWLHESYPKVKIAESIGLAYSRR